MYAPIQRFRPAGSLGLVLALVATMFVVASPALADHDPVGDTNISVSDAEVAEGNGGGLPNTMTFTITADPVPNVPVTVSYRTVDFTATSGSDYIARSGQVVLPAGGASSTASVVITVIGDTVKEPNEFFTLIISDASTGHITDSSGTGTIVNDDGATVSIEDVDVAEAGGEASLTISMAEPATDDVTVRYSTSNGTATAGSDYTARSNVEVVIPKGGQEVEATVPILQDTTDESDETFDVSIEIVSGTAAAGDTTGVVTILDDDDPASVTIANASKAEGEGTQSALSDTREQLEFVVSVTGSARSSDITFDIEVQGVTATASSTTTTADFTAPSGSPFGGPDYTIEPTENSVTVVVHIDGDSTPEPHETLTVEIVNLQGAGFGAQRKATGTILNDDATPQITAGDAKEEGDAAEVEFTLSIPYKSVRDVTLGYATSISGDDTSSTTTSDFVATSGSEELKAGETSKKITVLLKEDTIDEPDVETFTVTASGTTNASGSATAKGQILDDDAAPVISVDSRSVNEGDGGTSEVAVTIRRSANSERTITYDVATRDGTARAGQDYTATSQTGRSFAATSSALTQTFLVPVIGDRDPEADETVLVTISNVANGTAAASPGVLTILNDDENLGIDDAEVTEPDAGTTTVDVIVRLGAQQSGTVTVDYATANGSATAGEDYTAKSGTVTFAPGDTEETITITILGDVAGETDETFLVQLSNASSNIVLADDEATVTIQDNDGVSLRVSNVSVNEGQSSTTDAVFTISLSNPSASTVEFDYTTVDDTAAGGSGILADDYETTESTIVSRGSIAPGDTSTTVTVPVQGDTDVEPNETFFLVISNPTGGANIDDDTGVGTIVNDDAALSIEDANVVEGNSGTKQIEFTVSITQPSAVAVTFQYDTANGTATAGSDYQAVSNGGPATIPAGQTSTTISVNVIGDTVDEVDETFTVTLKNPTNATLADAIATGTIIDNDAAPTVSISDASVTEGDDGTVDMVFTVSLSAVSDKAVTVDYATADGTAKAADGDYQATSGELTFDPGDDVLIVTVVVAGDTVDEGSSESMRVSLSNPTNATIGDGTGIGTINDDDGADTNTPPTLEAGTNRAIETAAVTVFNATVSDADGDTVVVTWNFGDGSAPVVGNPVSHAFDRVGLFTVNVTASDGKGGQATDSFTVNAFDTGVVGRSSGDDRILTAVAASQAHWPSAGHSQASAHTGPAATEALIAHAYNYPDALAAGPLSAKLDAPLLLSDTASLPKVVEDELARLGVDTVWLLGGPNSLSPAIEQRLKDLGYEVKRRSGNSRFDTAAAIAKEVGRNSTGEVVLTLGEHADQNRAFPDALSAGSLSASPQQMPLLLTRADDLPAVTQQALADLNSEKVWIVGGPSSVSANVQARLIQLGYQVERLSGSGRYETSVDVAEEALSRAAAGPVRLVFATGAKFPDGLTGGAVAGRVDGILLLVPNGDLPAATRQFLADNADRFDVGVILGGANTLSESVRAALVDLMDN